MNIKNVKHPQIIKCIINQVVVGDYKTFDYATPDLCGVLFQYPNSDGKIVDYTEYIKAAHQHKVIFLSSSLTKIAVLKMNKPNIGVLKMNIPISKISNSS